MAGVRSRTPRPCGERRQAGSALRSAIICTKCGRAWQAACQAASAAVDDGASFVGDGEAAAHRVAVAGRQGSLEGRERPGQGNDGRIGRRGIALRHRLADPIVQDRDGVRLDRGCRPERPGGHLRVFLQGGRRKRAALRLGQIERRGKGLRQAEAVMVDAGDLTGRIDRQEFRRCRVQRRAGGGRIGETIGLDHRHMGEGEPELAGRPDGARRARAHAPCATAGPPARQPAGRRGRGTPGFAGPRPR